MFAVKTKALKGTRIVVRGAMTLNGVLKLPALAHSNIGPDTSEIVVDLCYCEVLSTGVVNAISQLRSAVDGLGITVSVANLSQMNKMIYDKMNLADWLPIVELESETN